jgi:hypothetical protein
MYNIRSIKKTFYDLNHDLYIRKYTRTSEDIKG